MAAGGSVPAQAGNANAPALRASVIALISRMKGHEDDGNVLWSGRSSSDG
jgi:hypothetical protein